VNAKAGHSGAAPKLGVGIHMGAMNIPAIGNQKDSVKGFEGLHGHGGAGNFGRGDDFTMDIEYSQKADGNGYIFKLKLIPKEDAIFPRISQNIYFLIDRSNSIRPERYEASKWGVIEALTLLQNGDTFNILMFDDKIQRLSSQNLEWNDQNILQAYDFLARQQNTAIGHTDLYNPLGEIFSEIVDDKEVNTAILLSDGAAYLSIDKLQSAIGRWTRQNAGKISLYSVASGTGNNLALLDLLSAVNKGVLHYTARDEDLPHLLSNLMLALQTPIGKDIETSIVVKEDKKNHSKVILFPSSTRLQNLYQRMPYIIYGTTDHLEDFHVFFQGKYYDKWLEIKQHISFQKAKKVSDSSLEKMWAIQQAYDHYDKYLRSGDEAHLQQAHRLLTLYKISTPF
jgi:hypothetical protein